MNTEDSNIEIKKQAKALMDEFASSLKKVKFNGEKVNARRNSIISPAVTKPDENPKGFVTKPVGGFREEGEGFGCDPEFRKAFFANAPRKEGDFILAEKKQW